MAARHSSPRKVVTPQAIAKAPVARQVFWAGLGAATLAQDEVVKAYERISQQAERLAEIGHEVTETLAKKAGLYVQTGHEVQVKAVAAAEAKAREAVREVQAFAKKSEKALKKNVEGKLSATITQAQQGVTQLEQVFETRVARTLNTFGLPSSQDVKELQSRMVALQKALNQLNKRTGAAQ
ncbi:MAG: phasin family protein [Betaproteobacteria bacterium]|nr:phasin family protein [Betaproteobacteria bacterium]